MLPMVHLPAIAEAMMRAVEGGRSCNAEIGNLLPGLLDAAGLEVELHVTTMVVRATTPEWSWPNILFRDRQALFFGSPMMEVVGR